MLLKANLQKRRCMCLHNHDKKRQQLLDVSLEANFWRRFQALENLPHKTVPQNNAKIQCKSHEYNAKIIRKANLSLNLLVESCHPMLNLSSSNKN